MKDVRAIKLNVDEIHFRNQTCVQCDHDQSQPE